MKKKYLILILLFVFNLKIMPKTFKFNSATEMNFDLGFASFYLNDQRIQWSGMEATFGVEAYIKTDIVRKLGKGNLNIFSEIRFNQPFDDNKLVDKLRSKYIQNFEMKSFDLSRLFIGYNSGGMGFYLGKKETNFGKDNLIHLFNSEFDLPFIRTESILLRETGFFIFMQKGVLDLSLSIVNGGPEMDTNSSKSGIVRFGIKTKALSFGVSAKFQDGIGSEDQKEFKNHVGFDMLFKFGRFQLSGEFIYDEYGFRKEYDPDNIFWKRSLYDRDIFYKSETPITGLGGYVDIQYNTKSFTLNINYGEFYPEKIGIPSHDEPIRRGIVKTIFNSGSDIRFFIGGLFENERPVDPAFEGRSGYAFFLGAVFNLK